MTDLEASLRAVVAEQPAVADWPGLVRGRVVVRKRRRAIAASGAVIVVLMSGVAVIASGLAGPGSDMPAVTPSSTPTADETTPIVVYLDPERTEVQAGVPVDFVVVSHAFLDGPPDVQELVLDGTQAAPDSVPGCVGAPPGESEPPVRRESTQVSRTFTRTLSPGTHVLVVRASAGCSRPGGSASRTYSVVARP